VMQAAVARKFCFRLSKCCKLSRVEICSTQWC
jgi:hypothetical protein